MGWLSLGTVSLVFGVGLGLVLHRLALFLSARNHDGIDIPVTRQGVLSLVLVSASMSVLGAVSPWTWQEKVAWLGLSLVLVTAVGTDLMVMKVPNRLTLPGAVLVYVLCVGSGWQSWWQSALGAFIGGGVIFVMFVLSRGKMGLGDAKLYLSIGAFLGPLLAMESLFLAALSGVIVGVGLRVYGKLQKREPMPFVPYIAIGVVLTASYGPVLLQWYLNHML